MATSDITIDSKPNKDRNDVRRKNRPVIGRRFGRLLAISLHHKQGDRRYIECQCECGNTTVVCSANLCSGRTQSCGCLALECKGEKANGYKHGASYTRTYGIWSHILDRCTNPNSAMWAHYGGRGITVCERWRDFQAFLSDMGEATGNLSIERMDVNGNYEPGNCTWATQLEQSRNKRNNVRIEFDGRSQILVDWATELGIKRQTLQARLDHGWTVEETLTTPIYGGTPKAMKERRKRWRKRLKRQAP